jgi:D-lactate dehydrogenase (cytochrome)
VAVPISAYPELIGYIQQVKAEKNVDASMLGHAGDGNIHVEIAFDDEESYQKALHMNGLVVQKALELGGTATGEHGVGIGKQRYMAKEHGAALDVMRDIKQVFDPNGILNPGKIFPDTLT